LFPCFHILYLWIIKLCILVGDVSLLRYEYVIYLPVCLLLPGVYVFYLFFTDSVICNAHSDLYPLLFPNQAIMYHVMNKWVIFTECFATRKQSASQSANHSVCLLVNSLLVICFVFTSCITSHLCNTRRVQY
jgi:hypothetical protein